MSYMKLRRISLLSSANLPRTLLATGSVCRGAPAQGFSSATEVIRVGDLAKHLF